MFEAFIEFLDQLYWIGYGLEFEEENPKHLALMKTMDYLNQKIGKKKVQIANQNLEKTWDMNQNHLSPRYTTNIKEILEVKCQ